MIDNKGKTMDFRKYTALAIITLVSLSSHAEPTSAPVNITYLRPYANNLVLLQANIGLGIFCSTSNYSIDISTNTGKAQYALALSAMLTNRLVLLELVSAGCGGSLPGYNALQSITLLP
jgi:hypothetical protein